MPIINPKLPTRSVKIPMSKSNPSIGFNKNKIIYKLYTMLASSQ